MEDLLHVIRSGDVVALQDRAFDVYYDARDWIEVQTLDSFVLTPNYVLFVAHCIWVGLGARKLLRGRPQPISWFGQLVLTFLLTTSGGLVPPMMLGLPIGWLNSGKAFLTVASVWTALNLVPFDFFYQLASFFPIKVVLCTLNSINRSHSLVRGIKLANVHLPGSSFGAIVMGVMCGSTGLFLLDLVRFALDGSAPNATLLNPGWSFLVAVIFVVIQYVTTDPQGLVAEQFALDGPLVAKEDHREVQLALIAFLTITTVLTMVKRSFAQSVVSTKKQGSTNKKIGKPLTYVSNDSQTSSDGARARPNKNSKKKKKNQ